MGMFGRIFAKSAPAQPRATDVPVTKPVMMRLSEIIRAKAKAKRKERQKVFVTAMHPPAATPVKEATIAQDSAITSAQTWADGQLQGFGYSEIEEGQTFLGYAYLAELAQRAEYRIASETIADEMTREWIRFTSIDDTDEEDKAKAKAKATKRAKRIKELTAEFKRLGVREVIREAIEQDGFFGRGHIFIDTGDTEDPDEMKTSIGDGRDAISVRKIQQGSVKALRTVEAIWCYPMGYNSTNPLSPDWYKPRIWYAMGQEIDASRMITIIGREVPDILKPTYSFGGLSLSQMMKPYVDNWLQTRQSVNDIIKSFVTWVLKTNMGALTQLDGETLFNRAEFFNDVRSNQGIMLIDKDKEDFSNVQATLSGLDHLQAQAQEHLCSVTQIPLVKYTGISPLGLNASSEGELKVFYDLIASRQEKQLRAPIHRLMGLAMLNLWGEIDESIGFEFEPLWSLTEKEVAEAEKTEAETDQVLIDGGIISPEEARRRLASDENGGYSWIDVDDVPDLREEEEEGLEPTGGRPDPELTGGNGRQPQPEGKTDV